MPELQRLLMDNLKLLEEQSRYAHILLLPVDIIHSVILYLFSVIYFKVSAVTDQVVGMQDAGLNNKDLDDDGGGGLVGIFFQVDKHNQNSFFFSY